MDNKIWYEIHVTVGLFPLGKNRFDEACARISRNPFKKTDSGIIFLVTLRDRTSSFCIFRAKLDALLADAKDHGFVPHKKIEVEFAVYDSNLDHDAKWIK